MIIEHSKEYECDVSDFQNAALQLYNNRHPDTGEQVFLSIGKEKICMYLPESLSDLKAKSALEHLLCNNNSKQATITVILVKSKQDENLVLLEQKFLNNFSVQENVVSKREYGFFYCYDVKNKFLLWIAKPKSELFYQSRRTVPFAPLFSVLFAHLGAQLTHAAIIANDHVCIAFCGPSGAGKSTTTLYSILNKYYYISEDYCLINSENGVPFAHSLYNSIRVRNDMLSVFPELAGRADYFCHIAKKNVFYATHLGNIKIARSRALKAIVKLTRGETSSYKKISAIEACSALMLSTIAQDKVVDTSGLPMIKRCCEQINTYELTLSFNMPENLNTIGQIFNEKCKN